MVGRLTDLFGRIAAFDAKLSTLHQARPSGVHLHLAGAEQTARGLERFSRDTPSLLRAVTLLEFNSGKQVWPPLAPLDASMFAPLPDDPRHSADWWKFREQDAAHARAESQRVNDYYERQNKLREDK
jgi:hypothetical protein